MNISYLQKFQHLVLVLMLISIPFFTKSQNRSLDEKGFIKINGIEQWITIKGDRSKPAILFIHGGPGSPMTPYADAIFKAWEEDFILVQWDQRGAGKTFGRTAPEELSPAYLISNPLSVEQIIDDGIAVAEYLTKHLNKKKLILFGTSWGSVIGIQMAEKKPELFHAYIGHAQIVYPSDNFKLAYSKTYQLAEEANDQNSLKILKSIGAPPYDTARHAGQLMRVVKKYERLNSTPEPETWWKISGEYDNEKDNQHRADGDDYSFVNFVGDKRLGVQLMSKPASALSFQIPIYLLQGESDILTPKEITKPYFDKITAPKKEYVLVPHAAHGFNAAIIDKLFKICKAIANY